MYDKGSRQRHKYTGQEGKHAAGWPSDPLCRPVAMVTQCSVCVHCGHSRVGRGEEGGVGCCNEGNS